MHRRRILRTGLAGAALVVSLALAAAPGTAAKPSPIAFSAPQTLTHRDGEVDYRGEVATGPTGRAAVLIASRVGFGAEGSLELQRLEADGTLGPLTTIIAPGTGRRATATAVAVDASDRATVVWTQGPDDASVGPTELDAVGIEPGGGAGPVVRLTSGAVGDVDIGQSASERTTVVCNCPRGIMAFTLAADGTLDDTDLLGGLLHREPSGHPVAPRVAVAASGAAIVAWNAPTRYRRRYRAAISVRMARIAPDGAASAPRTVSDRRSDAYGADVAVDRSGRFAAVWHRARPEELVVRELSRRAQPRRPSVIRQPGLKPGGPRIAINASGERLLTWSSRRDENPFGQRINLAAFGRGTGPGRSIVVARNRRNGVSAAQLGTDARGNGLLVWQSGGVFARAIGPDGKIGPRAAVSGPSLPGVSQFPDLAVGPGGAVSVVFARPTDATSSPANAPQESNAQLPGR